MKEERELHCLYLGTFQPSQRNEGSSVYIHVFEGRESLSPNFKLLTPGINFAIFSQKNHQAKNNCYISLTPTIVDSILCTFLIPGIDFPPPPPLYTSRNFASGCVC
jgi:hypothetical protein